ncbi:MAG: TonB-dependent receptor [Bacteroidales bacterium]
MQLIKFTVLFVFILISPFLKSQTNIADSTTNADHLFDEVIISANKVEESKRIVVQQVQILNQKSIELSQSQSSADLLQNTGNVFIQKSQLGGGSPVLRGFEASRVLLVVDGIRMNNLIYRAGHLQNVVTIDNNMLERAEILFGPSSTIYGSDALGGVVHFYTKKPLLAEPGQKSNLHINAFTRLASADNEFTGHLDFNLGSVRFASLTSFTASKFGHLRGGTNQNPFYDGTYGERPFYAERFGNKDSLVENSDRYLQVQSGYSQYDFLQKFLLKQNEKISHQLNFQFSTSTDVPRYDRLTDPTPSGLNYSEWYYGPQQRLHTAYDLNRKSDVSFFQNMHFGLNFQNIEESRHSRKFGNDNLSNRIENVNVAGFNLDLQSIKGKNNLRVGLEGQFNTLKSTANKHNIVTGAEEPLDTRYPDGENTMMNIALYLSHTLQINKELILTDGVRVGYTTLHCTFEDTTFFNFPYKSVDQKTPVLSGTIGLIQNPSDDWKLSLLVSTGFRVPNVDDLSKVFESSPGTVIVPNPDLKPEKTINFEAGITRFIGANTSWENTLYYSRFYDAIVTDDFLFNGQDSILYDGTMSKVMANQNKRDAYLYGFSSNLRSKLGSDFYFNFVLNYTYGRIKTESNDSPLDHIPPLMARIQLTYSHKNFGSDFFVNYNGAKKLKDYYLNGEDNEQYATPDGMPAWITLNLRISYKIQKFITIQAGIDNISDTQYRTFASGINAPGRNIFGAIRFNL